MDWFTVVTLIVIAVLILLPAKYDPAMRLVWWLRDRARRRRNIRNDGIPVTETPEGKLWTIIATNHCPKCNGIGFYEGPHGGMSINIECRNCGQRYNVTPAIGIAERI